MKTNQSSQGTQTEIETKQDSLAVDLTWTQQAYHEMADVPVVQVDLMAQFSSQLGQLEELQARTAFIMREVKYLLKA